jgi:3-hydroxyisobutyrate dehydrogenase-like beta-hydroxyacid dehydrogenase
VLPTIGLIGVGLMGHGIGRNLLEKDFGLAVLAHRRRDAVEDLLAKGAREADSPRALAQAADIVLVCVTGSPQFQAVADGDDGFIAGLSAGQTVIDCTTGEPDVTDDYASRLADLDVGFADAPLARTPVEAEAGRLNAMVGAAEPVFAKVQPVLEAFCENIFHVGDAGSGARMKLINNLITMGQAALIAEALVACKATGIAPRTFFEIMSKGGGNSGILQMLMPAYLDQGSFEGMQFSLQNAAKDLRYFNRMTGNAGLSAPLGAVVHNQLVNARLLGFEDGLVGHLMAAALQLNRLTED